MPKKICALFLSAVLLMLSGCSYLPFAPAEETDEPYEEITAEPIDASDDDRTINAAVYDFDTYNPIITESQSVRDCMRFVYEPLYELGEGLLAEGVLAEGRTVSADGRTITVTLKSGVKWHDGTSLTADDVAYTVSAIKSTGGYYSRMTQNIASCKRVSENTVQFTLIKPEVDYAAMLCFPIIKNDTSLKVSEDYIPVGTGPYKYAGRTKTDTVLFEDNPDWHKGWVNIAAISVVSVSDKEKALSMFEMGETDIVTDDVIDFAEYTPRGGVTILEYTTNDLVYVGINFNNRLFWGENTRRALAAAVNKSEIATSVIYKRGVEVDVPINPSSYYYYDTAERFPAKPQTAEENFAADGWVMGDDGILEREAQKGTEKLKFEILANADDTENTAVAEVIAEYYKSYGVDATVDACEEQEYKSKISSKDFDLFIGEMTIPENMNPSELVASGENPFTYANDEMDNIINTMRQTMDTETLKTLFIEYGTLVAEDTPFVPLYFKKGATAYRAKITSGVEANISNPYKNVGEWQLKW